ncbi:MAG: DNA mismatch repair endonuclease MutL [Spirochaetota bacterium]
MPEEVSMKIAAGEVIEGPSSVVRELIDNSLDANSIEIKVVVNNGGKDYIMVSDNGDGMSPEDAALSVQKHTTSKIRGIEDLLNIRSMGFRGEALSSICAVSDVSIITRLRGDETGTRVNCSFGGSVSSQPSPSNEGTTVIVKNLFHNLPARKKFLKSSTVESLKVRDEVLKKALGFPEMGFFYKVDDRVVYSLTPGQELRSRIEQIFGKGLKENLIEVLREDDIFSISGFISGARYTLPHRGSQYIFINRRPIMDRALLFALNKPCRGIVPSGRFIYAFLYISADPMMVDINIHPAKKEVRYKYANRLYSIISETVEKALRGRFYTSYPPGSIKPGEIREDKTLEESRLLYAFDSPGFIAGKAGKPFDQKVQEASIPEASIPIETYSGVSEDAVSEISFKTFPTGVLLRQGITPLLPGCLLQRDVRRLHFRDTIFKTYLLFEGEEFLLFLDQHAAHERILYERFKKLVGMSVPVKGLLLPINFSPPGEMYAEVVESLLFFSRAGIEIEPFGDGSFNVVSLPAFIPDGREEDTIGALLDDLLSGRIPRNPGDIQERFLEIAACRAAVKEGDELNKEEAFAILNDLLETSVPQVCPHGRPTMIQFLKDDFKRIFRRK